MRTRTYILIAISVIAVAVCVRLGIWQLNRRNERIAYNNSISTRLTDAPTSLNSLPSDTSQLRFRRVNLHGVYDYSHEIVLTNRVRNGSPGVHLITPLLFNGSDSAVLVIRGWVYTPDGVTANIMDWREADSLSSDGFVIPLPTPGAGNVQSPTNPNAYRWIDLAVLAKTIPYPLHNYVVVLAGDTTHQEGIPPRVSPPILDEGPHLVYAIQWFSFATIFLIGTVFFVRKNRPSSKQGDSSPTIGSSR